MSSFSDNYRIRPGSDVRLKKIDPTDTGDFACHEDAQAVLDAELSRLRALQARLYAGKKKSLLIVLQGLDASGKDGVVRHVLTGLNPEGTKVAAFKQPSHEDAAHDFLWRVHPHAPAKGEIAVFNRSHYEDVLVVRVHDLAPKSVWKSRYAHIVAFEDLLADQNQTAVVKFFLHISQEEQLARFKVRLDDPDREWKISEADYSERGLWAEYTEAFEEAISKTSTKSAPWFVIPSDHKWFRDLMITQILADTLEALDLGVPDANVDLEKIRQDFARAEANESEESRQKVEKLIAKKEKKLRKAEKKLRKKAEKKKRKQEKAE